MSNDATIGLNVPGSASTPSALNACLERIRQDGFDVAELGMDSFPVIIGGEIVPGYVDWLGKQLERHPLRYSAHIGRGVDLRSTDNYDLAKNVLFRTIEICGELSLSPLTLHFELTSDSAEIEKRFYHDHSQAADYAAERGVLLCIENIEVEKVEPVVQMVETLKHPALGMTFDFGHAYLAAAYFGFDFLDSVRRAAPFVSHLHMSGNTGVFETLRVTDRPVYDALPKGYRMAFGRGDIHAPPLWGTIPYKEALQSIGAYSGIYLCEYYSNRFLPFNRQVQEQVRELIDRNEQDESTGD